MALPAHFLPLHANSHASHALQEVQNSVVFQAQSAAHTLSNCLARVNFVLKTGSQDTSTTSSGVLLRGGAAATLDRTSVIFQVRGPY